MKKHRVAYFFLFALFAVFVAAPASAHHSFAMFDLTRVDHVKGTVMKFEWTNPHAWIWVATTDAKGATQPWAFECASLTMLRRQGWTRDRIKAGDKVDVEFHPFRDGKQKGGMMMSVNFDGDPGRTISGRPPGGGEPAPPGGAKPSTP